MDEMDRLEYHVDANGVLTFVGQGWDDFALANDGKEHVLAADVVGRPLLEFVTGRALAHLWETLMARISASGRGVVVPFRCDAPALIRSMQMAIEPLPDAGLRFVTSVIEAAERPRAAVIDVNAPRSHDRLLWMCSWCKRLQLEGRWLELDEAAREFGLFESGDLPEVTHGLCPSCERAVVAELEKLQPEESPSASGVDRGRLDLI